MKCFEQTRLILSTNREQIVYMFKKRRILRTHMRQLSLVVTDSINKATRISLVLLVFFC